MGVVLFYLHSLLYRYFLLPAILTVVFAVWYRMSLKKGKRRKFLDFLAGLSLLCTVACIYVYWCTTRGSNMFLDMFYFTYLPDSGFLTLILQSVYMLALFGVWTLLVRFVFAAGPNWTLHLTTILFFGIMTLYVMLDFLGNAPAIWGIIGILWYPLVAFVGFCVIYFQFVNFYRCPVCHASGKKAVSITDVEDLGFTTDHSVEYRHRTEHESETRSSEHKEIERRIREKYDVYKTRRHTRYYMHCNKCGHEWNADTSRTLHTDKNLSSVRKDTTTKIWRW